MYKDICAFFKLLKAAFVATNTLATMHDCGYRGCSLENGKVYIDQQKANLAEHTRLTERNYMPVEPVDYIRR